MMPLDYERKRVPLLSFCSLEAILAKVKKIKSSKINDLHLFIDIFFIWILTIKNYPLKSTTYLIDFKREIWVLSGKLVDLRIAPCYA